MKSVTFSQPATLLKVTLFDGCFSRFLNCANGTKSRKTSHMCCYYPAERTLLARHLVSYKEDIAIDRFSVLFSSPLFFVKFVFFYQMITLQKLKNGFYFTYKDLFVLE